MTNILVNIFRGMAAGNREWAREDVRQFLWATKERQEYARAIAAALSIVDTNPGPEWRDVLEELSVYPYSREVRKRAAKLAGITSID